jgi:predicted metal-dependent hydrolase
MNQMTLFDISSLNDSAEPQPATDAEAWPEPTGASSPDETETREITDAPEIEVRISTRRRKTSEARWVSGRIVVSLPSHLDLEARRKTTDWLVDRLMTRHRLQSSIGDDDLRRRANALSDRYALGAYPSSVRWVTNQKARWGSCSYHSKEIRISHRLRVVPEWVLDSVLVHELAHLTHPDHSGAFHRLADAYPRHGEAAIFLAGFGLGLSNPPV